MRLRFHGSYRREDVEFLLKPIVVEPMEDPLEKERLIQSGRKHYSEMLSPERRPTERYTKMFFEAHARNRMRLARDCVTLAEMIQRDVAEVPTIVSLARAGTPVGAIVTHLLRRKLSREIRHYSISIIRDRGIDRNALRAILEEGVTESSITFVDGWTGKGVISQELNRSVAQFNAAHGTVISSNLYVLADLAGTAKGAATTVDYLIPCAILNATIAGLVSRSVLNEAIGPNDFHGCVYMAELADQDLSVWFVEDVLRATADAEPDGKALADGDGAAGEARARSEGFMRDARQRYGVVDENRIKPGIGEATRVLLRRTPERVIVRDRELSSVQHLLELAAERKVLVEERPDLAYEAAAIIRSAR